MTTVRRSPRFFKPAKLCRRRKRSRPEVLPARKLHRGVVKIPKVIGAVFKAPRQPGDFVHELRTDYRTLFVYNENAFTQTDKRDNHPGGGNAAIRPYRPSGRAIGIPTGYEVGFASMSSTHPRFGYARSLIDGAIDEIVEHVVAYPNRFDAIKFSATEDGKLGTGIFHVGDDVRDYITHRLTNIPKSIDRRMHKKRFGLDASSPLDDISAPILSAPTLSAPAEARVVPWYGQSRNIQALNLFES